ncbi:MAG: phosphoribosylformylglycinamidine cyclo-ligase [Thermoplasmatales archaeon]
MVKYKDAGVDFDAIGKFRKALISKLNLHGNWKVPIGIGHYAGLIEYGDNYLALHTDGIGTKTLLALKYRYFKELGFDLVGMNVNDLLAMNIEPVAMVDYISSSIFDVDLANDLGTSLDQALTQSKISIIGGETASIPDIINGIDIAGTVLGIVKKSKLVDGSKIAEGDVILGIESSGFHSNGYSLIRKVLESNLGLDNEILNGEKLWKLLLKGTKIYRDLILEINEKYEIKGMAHITGGGFRNILRLKNMLYEFNIDYEIPPLFQEIIKAGNIDYNEAFQTFNMGIGFMLILEAKEARNLSNEYQNLIKIGEVKRGQGIVINPHNLRYESYY